MQWSALRAKVRDLICPELGRRIDFHVTSCRGSHDEAEKAWITIDGERLLTCSWYQHQWYGWPRDEKGRLDHPGPFPSGDRRAADGIFLPQALGTSLREYLDMPIHHALVSPNPFIKALSIIDRRVGRRTLEAITLDESEA